MSLKQSPNGRIAKNAFFLYLLTFSNYFLGLLLIPYESRVLGPSAFGLVGFAMAFALLFQVIVDFGFMVSATEQISRHRSDTEKVARIVSSTMHAKIYLSLVSLVVFAVTAFFVPMVHSHFWICFLFVVNGILTALMPDFFYRGIEKMKTVTLRTVFVRGAGVVLVLLFVKSPDQAVLVPVFFVLSSTIALVAVLYDILRNHKVRLRRVQASEVLGDIRLSLWFFFSRVAVNVNSSISSFFLGLQYAPASVQMGIYTGARNLTQAAEMMVSPVTDSLYPHMVKEKNYKLLKKMLILGVIVMFIGCMGVGIFAEQFCVLLLGNDYRQAGGALRILLVSVFFAYPNMLLGFPALSPIGLSKHANIANIISAVCVVSALTVLWLTHSITVITVCMAVALANIVMLAYRGGVLWRNRGLTSGL